MRRLWPLRRKSVSAPSLTSVSSEVGSREVTESARSVSIVPGSDDPNEENDQLGDLPPSIHPRGLGKAEVPAESGIDGSEDDKSLSEFFTIDDGASVFDDIKTIASTEDLSRATTKASRASITSVSSRASSGTFLPADGVYGLPLSHLDRLIHPYPSLRKAQIISSECYTEPIRFGVVHRFLLLDLRREGRKTIWIRLDRTRLKTVGPFDFVRGGLQTPANDIVQISASRFRLIGRNATCENRQIFDTLPHLGDLFHLIHVIGRELTTYRLLTRNCWFFVSLLQQHLGTLCEATLVYGKLPARNVDRAICSRIETQVMVQSDFERSATSASGIRDPSVDFGLDDLETYASYVLRPTPDLAPDSPGLLSRKAQGSYVWLVIACRYIAHGADADGRLRRVLESNEGLDGLYTCILSDGEKPLRDVRSHFLALMLSAASPLPLSELLKLPPARFPPDVDTVSAVTHLAPILRGISSNDSVAPYHASFAEYLGDLGRSGLFYIDPLEVKSLRVMCDASKSLEMEFPDIPLQADDLVSCFCHELGALEERAPKGIALSLLTTDYLRAPIATACRSVIHKRKVNATRNFYQGLHEVFSTGEWVDMIYTALLEECCRDAPSDFVLLLLCLFLSTQAPLALSEYAKLAQDHLPAGIGLSAIRTVLRPFCADICGIDTDEAVQCNTSVSTFLWRTYCGGRLFVESKCAADHGQWAEFCITTMNQHLRFNIANIPSSLLRNTDVPCIKQRIEANLPPFLVYACQFWPIYVSAALQERVTIPSLVPFLQDRVLQWLEVMSLIGRSPEVTLVPFNKARMVPPLVSELIAEIMQFVRMFATPIAISVPHIYLSALPFVPECSAFPFWQSSHLKITRGRLKGWPSCMNILHEHNNRVNSIAYSPDGTRMASCSEGTVRLWDTWTGSSVLLIRLHEFRTCRWPTSTVFSSDSVELAVGTVDPSVNWWNTQTGHTRCITYSVGQEARRSFNNVAISPDFTRVAVSRVNDIFLWDVPTHEIIDKLVGHSRFVHSVVFSHDGAQIASGSSDRICIWDTWTGARQTLFGHSGRVLSLAFSSDGGRLVSGSYDHTVRLWDTETGAAVGHPLLGHTGYVRSVAFSPNNMWVASGSFDGTVRLWDAQTGAAVGQLLVGHRLEGSISSIAFSPDGTRIASGSEHGIVRVWDAGIVTAEHSHQQGQSERSMNGSTVPEHPVLKHSNSHDAGHRLRDAFITYSPKRSSSGAILLQDGWIVGQNGELLLWIPAAHRTHIANTSEKNHTVDSAVDFDFQNFTYGENWAQCLDRV